MSTFADGVGASVAAGSRNHPARCEALTCVTAVRPSQGQQGFAGGLDAERGAELLGAGTEAAIATGEHHRVEARRRLNRAHMRPARGAMDMQHAARHDHGAFWGRRGTSLTERIPRISLRRQTGIPVRTDACPVRGSRTRRLRTTLCPERMEASPPQRRSCWTTQPSTASSARIACRSSATHAASEHRGGRGGAGGDRAPPRIPEPPRSTTGSE